jgi:hypothetical protein
MISLGGNCSITYQLNNYNLREKAYPFDWCKISINQLLQVLENNFNNYVETITIKKYSENHDSYLATNIYNIQFAHEINDYNLIDFKNSLTNRIQRFQNLNDVTFLRIELEPVKEDYINKIEKLVELLSKYASNFIIKLVLKNKININNDKIKVYYYNDLFTSWQMNNINWNEIII